MPSDSLRSIRPDIPVDTAESTPVETFQHETLRPILKLLNPNLVALTAHTLTKYGTGFAEMDRADQVRRLRNLMTQDSRLKRTAVGMVMGHFTEEEFAFFLTHQAELRRRTIEMLETRVVDQVDAIAEHTEASV